MADLLVLILSILVILLLITAWDHTLALPFLNPSRREVRDLLVAVEDLLLPMGSFPSKLLQPWVPTVKECRSRPTALTLSHNPTPAEEGSEPSTPASTEPTPGESGSNPTAVPPSTEPTSVVGGPNPTMLPLSTEQAPGHGKSKLTTIPPPPVPVPVVAGFDTTTLPPLPEPTPVEGQSFGPEDDPDKPLFDSLEYQQLSGDDIQMAFNVPLPEQQGAEIDSLSSDSTVAGEETEKEEQEQEVEDSTAVVEKESTETEVFEKEIRGLVDPEGRYGPDLRKTIELVAGTVERQAKAEEGLRSETVRFQRAEDDLRHGWEDSREVFERIISGQNVMLRLTRDENHELVEENQTLLSKNAGSMEKYQRMLDQYNNHLNSLNVAKESAEQAAETAIAGVNGRIDAVKESYEQKKSAAELINRQERNALNFSKEMVENNLAEARRQVTAGEQQHDAAIKEKDSTIKELKVVMRQLRSTVTTSEELAASAERGLQKQLDDRCKEKDREIGTLKDQLRELEDRVKALGGWKDKAEAEQRNHQRTSSQLNDQMTALREDKNHLVHGLKLEIGGLQRSIKEEEDTIADLRRKVTSLKSGQEVKDLKSQLGEAKKQQQLSVKETQDLRQQLQDCQHGVEKLRDTVKARDKKIEKDAEISSKKKEDLEKRLEQATCAQDRGLEEAARKVEEQKKELSRELKDAQEAEQKAGADLQRLEDTRKRTTIEHQNAMKEKDEEINRLGQTIQDARAAAAAKANEAGKEATEVGAGEERQNEMEKRETVEIALKKAAEDAKDKDRQHEKDKKEAVEKAVREAAEDATKKQRQYEEEKKKAVENAVRKAEEDANMEVRQHEKDKKEAVEKAAKDADDKERQHMMEKKEAAEKAVKEAAEGARQTLQKQLDDERESSRQAQNKAIETETNLRTEISGLRSQVGEVVESKSVDPANSQPGRDAKELTVIAREATEAHELLLEIEGNGVIQGSVEHTVLRQLNNAKLALYWIKCDLRKPRFAADKHHFRDMTYGVEVKEEDIKQLNMATHGKLVQQGKVANARMQNLRYILDTNNDVQKDAMLEAIYTPNPIKRETKKARGLKRHTQPGPGMLPSVPSTIVQAEHSTGHSQQRNGNPEPQYDPRLFNPPQNVQPQLSAATSQDQTQGFLPTPFDGAASGFSFQLQTKATPDFTSAQGVPGSADDGSSSLTAQSQGDQQTDALGFDFGAIDESHPVWKGISFGKQKEASEEAGAAQSTTVLQESGNAEPSSAQYTPSTGFQFGKTALLQPLTIADVFTDVPSTPMNNEQSGGSMDRSTGVKKDHNAKPSSAQYTPTTGFQFGKLSLLQPLIIADTFTDNPSMPMNNAQNGGLIDRSTAAKKDHRQPFADIMALLKLPTSSEKATIAAVPEPVPKNNRTSTTGPTDIAAKTSRTYSVVKQSPFPGLQDDNGIAGPVSEPTFQRPKNNIRGRGRFNASKGRLLAHQAFATRQTVPSPESTQAQQPDPQEQGSVIQQGGSGGSVQHDHNSDKPIGWTDLMTNAVMDELRRNSDVGLDFLGEFLRLNYDLETDDIQGLNKFLEMLRQEVKPGHGSRSDQPKGWTAGMTSFVEVLLNKGHTSADRIITLLNREYGNVSAIEGVGKYVERLKTNHKTGIPEMPTGWTKEHTAKVRGMLRDGDEIDFIEEIMNMELDLPADDTGCWENWLKKLQSDYQAEAEDPMLQD
ncbi:hypothetical protein HO133_003140 [Letharia lupina]|uniref:Uncharacterized protein n=1 Tax=Letharia lupina TaxID=560253 RepID=A0A8H6CC41_9LECA|nr:uncharacterized protein HO133_003140 [Letharia lupina]KAF6220707.1 hypothetical protein HO133_003140 [Letharia lupina]